MGLASILALLGTECEGVPSASGSPLQVSPVGLLPFGSALGFALIPQYFMSRAQLPFGGVWPGCTLGALNGVALVARGCGRWRCPLERTGAAEPGLGLAEGQDGWVQEEGGV